MVLPLLPGLIIFGGVVGVGSIFTFNAIGDNSEKVADASLKIGLAVTVSYVAIAAAQIAMKRYGK
jgi:hypothetical protein